MVIIVTEILVMCFILIIHTLIINRGKRKKETKSKELSRVCKDKVRSERIEALYKKIESCDFTDDVVVEFCVLCFDKEFDKEKETINSLLRIGFSPDEILSMSGDFLDEDTQ